MYVENQLRTKSHQNLPKLNSFPLLVFLLIIQFRKDLHQRDIYLLYGLKFDTTIRF